MDDNESNAISELLVYLENVSLYRMGILSVTGFLGVRNVHANFVLASGPRFFR